MGNTKICFVCAGLEPGKDAVGDYTVEIARRLVSMGWTVTIIALADRHVAARSEGLRAGCPIIRYPKKSPWDLRWQHLADFVKATQPDWVGLQWVAFGFQSKGLPLAFGRRLRKAIGNVPVQVMCHEIWVWADGYGTLKERLYSRLQRAVHRRTFKAINPVSVHTHAEPYRRALDSIGVSASILPLGSNIHPDQLVERDVEDEEPPYNAENELAFIVFGNTPPEWDARAVVQKLGSACKRMDKKAHLWFVGKGGPDSHELARLVLCGKEVGVSVESLGFLETNRLRYYMRHAHAGIATVPFALWQKSSAVAAMRTSGLPVLFTRFDGAWSEDWLPSWEEGFFRLEEGGLEVVLKTKRKEIPDLWKAAIKRFSADLGVINDDDNSTK